MATKKDIKASLALAQKIREFVVGNFGWEVEDGRKPHNASEQPFFEFMLPTVVGLLKVTIIRGDPRWVFGIFDFPQKAQALLGESVNRYSGKWNHCWEQVKDPAEIVAMFASLVEPILMVSKHPDVISR
jgi:hypothetical protein